MGPSRPTARRERADYLFGPSDGSRTNCTGLPGPALALDRQIDGPSPVACAVGGSSKLRGNGHPLGIDFRRDCWVQWNRTRRRWWSRLRKPKAMRAASLIMRLVPSVPALVCRVSRKPRDLRPPVVDGLGQPGGFGEVGGEHGVAESRSSWRSRAMEISDAGRRDRPRSSPRTATTSGGSTSRTASGRAGSTTGCAGPRQRVLRPCRSR